ncbi:hypothetical protein [Candidatus Uabimicrobium sp. HlEnr_7]|uniref:hypothetical protein n=1 Tax=Candidatus Uabimicrobium helgolandensis TaxID=3095367 RepID=UPI003556D73B
MLNNQILMGCFQPWKTPNQELQVSSNLVTVKLITFRNSIYCFDKDRLFDPKILGLDYIWKCSQYV